MEQQESNSTNKSSEEYKGFFHNELDGKAQEVDVRAEFERVKEKVQKSLARALSGEEKIYTQEEMDRLLKDM